MPKGDGLTVLRFIRDPDTGARVIMLTGDDSRHSVQTARKLGANDYLIKKTFYVFVGCRIGTRRCCSQGPDARLSKAG